LVLAGTGHAEIASILLGSVPTPWLLITYGPNKQLYSGQKSTLIS
jgi:hypothetical protein